MNIDRRKIIFSAVLNAIEPRCGIACLAINDNNALIGRVLHHSIGLWPNLGITLMGYLKSIFSFKIAKFLLYSVNEGKSHHFFHVAHITDKLLTPRIPFSTSLCAPDHL